MCRRRMRSAGLIRPNLSGYERGEARGSSDMYSAGISGSAGHGKQAETSLPSLFPQIIGDFDRPPAYPLEFRPFSQKRVQPFSQKKRETDSALCPWPLSIRFKSVFWSMKHGLRSIWKNKYRHKVAFVVRCVRVYVQRAGTSLFWTSGKFTGTGIILFAKAGVMRSEGMSEPWREVRKVVKEMPPEETEFCRGAVILQWFHEFSNLRDK